jgi:hypothetical protein
MDHKFIFSSNFILTMIFFKWRPSWIPARRRIFRRALRRAQRSSDFLIQKKNCNPATELTTLFSRSRDALRSCGFAEQNSCFSAENRFPPEPAPNGAPENSFSGVLKPPRSTLLCGKFVSLKKSRAKSHPDGRHF